MVVGSGLRHRVGAFLKRQALGEQVAVVTSPNIAKYYKADVCNSLTAAGFSPIVISLPSGERYKTLDGIRPIYDQLVRHKFERRATLIALGGGVIGDMTGFAAATYLRGIGYLQMPTTVVAAVDASIGGKTGVDHPQGKNLIGAFHQPCMVVADIETLKTLSRREYQSGLAEVVKYGVIQEASFFDYLEQNTDAILNREPAVLSHVVHRSAAIKAAIVQADEKEMGLRRILNYGHTIGHAVETLTGYRRYKHGEAVAMGMIAASRLACCMGLLSKDAVVRQRALLKRFGLPTALPPLDPNAMMAVMAQDKKVQAGAKVFVLPDKIGACRVMSVADAVLKKFLVDGEEPLSKTGGRS